MCATQPGPAVDAYLPSGALNVASFNANSLLGHFPFFSAHVASTSYHIIAVTETWFHDRIPDDLVALPAFFLIRNDRVGKRGGEVACYIHNSLRFKLLAISAPEFSNALEYLIGEIRNSQNRAVLFAAVYKRPKGILFNDFAEILSGLSINYQNIIVTGDLNCDLLQSNFESNSLRDFAHSHALHIVESGATFHTNSSHSLLDVFLVDSPSKVISFSKSFAPFIAGHDLLELIYKFQPDFRPPRTITRRDLKHFVVSDYLASISSSLLQ